MKRKDKEGREGGEEREREREREREKREREKRERDDSKLQRERETIQNCRNIRDCSCFFFLLFFFLFLLFRLSSLSPSLSLLPSGFVLRRRLLQKQSLKTNAKRKEGSQYTKASRTAYVHILQRAYK